MIDIRDIFDTIHEFTSEKERNYQFVYESWKP